MPRARGIQIYLKPGIEEDDILLRLWEVCKTRSRPQEMFRRLLTKGFYHMVVNKDISDSILEEIGWDLDKEIPSTQSLEIEEKIEPNQVFKKPIHPKKYEEKNNKPKPSQEKLESNKASLQKPNIGKDLM
jgi:hypothetical protein